jgi:outer membrane protein TolC
VLEAAAALEASEQSLETAVLSLSIAEVRRENNMINSADYLQALAEKENRETARNLARRDLLLNGKKLQSLTGLSKLPRLEAVDFTGWEALLQRFANLDDTGFDTLCDLLGKTAAARNPGIIRAGLLSRRAEESVTLSKRDYNPSLSASLSTGLNYSPANGLEPSSGRLSVSGSIPLDFWVTAANVEKKELARDQAVFDYQSTEQNLDTELQTILLDLISQAQSVLSFRRAGEYAQKHYEYVLELYRLSRNSLSELFDAETLVRTNRNQLIRAQYGFLRGLSKIRSLGAFESADAIFRLTESAVSGLNP